MSAYVLTGANAAFAAEFAPHLRLPVHAAPPAAITTWIHVVPDGSGDDQPGALAEAVERAEAHLPVGEGAGFVAVVPVWGVIAPPLAEPAELAAAAVRALVRSRMERWSRHGRRINLVAYGGLDTAALPGLRDTATLEARTPMHRRGSLAELADAIDFLSSSAAAYVTGSELPVDGGWAAYSWFYPARDL